MKIALFQGEDKGESGSLVRDAVDLHLSPMCFNDIFNDGQPQAGAAHFPGSGFVDAIKPFKDPGQIIFRDADAGIRHRDFYKIITFVVRRSSNSLIR